VIAKPVAVMAAVALAGFGWALPWADPARAGAALQWLGFAALCWLLRGPGRALRAACAVGAAIGLAGSSCAAWWETLSQIDGVCDAATGRPVTAAAAVAVLAVAAEFLRGGDHDGTQNR
jgi:hypothetical protein